MQVILPYRAKNVTTTNIPIFTETPYLNKSMEKDQMLNLNDILIRLQAALEDKDWDAIELLMEDVEIEVENESYNQGYDQFVNDDDE
tara:strand:- start:422 stop:682 length:261 start_codon:yes stop_codon:yes gene_type:complete